MSNKYSVCCTSILYWRSNLDGAINNATFASSITAYHLLSQVENSYTIDLQQRYAGGIMNSLHLKLRWLAVGRMLTFGHMSSALTHLPGTSVLLLRQAQTPAAPAVTPAAATPKAGNRPFAARLVWLISREDLCSTRGRKYRRWEKAAQKKQQQVIQEFQVY